MPSLDHRHLNDKLANVARGRLPVVLLGTGTAAICLASAVNMKLPDPWFGNISAPAELAYALMPVAFAALTAPFLRQRTTLLQWAIFAFWVAAAIASGVSAIAAPIPGAVSFLEAVALACVFYMLACRSDDDRLLIAVIAVMLVTFGTVHLIHRDAISGLLPAGFPAPQLWPLITGPMLILCGIAQLFQKFRPFFLTAVAAMFAAWLPLVHIPRLFSDPSVDEAIFAATAVALIGCLLWAMRANPHQPEEITAAHG